MANEQTLTTMCIEACDDCALQCSGSAFEGEMMGGMELASSLGRECSDACSNHSKRLLEGDTSLARQCVAACKKFIPAAESAFRHLDSFTQSAVAAGVVIERIEAMAHE